MRSLVCVIILPDLPASVSERYWTEPLEQSTLLELFVERSCRLLTDRPLHVVCPDDSLFSELTALATSKAIRVVVADYYSPLRILEQLARLPAAGHIAVLQFGMLFGPSDMLLRVYQHHLATENDYTMVVGFPRGATPAIYRRSLVEALGELTVPGLDPEPALMIDVILKTNDLTGGPPILKIRAQPFDALASYDARPDELPEAILLDAPHALDVATAVVPHVRSDVHDDLGVRGFKLWKRAEMLAGKQRLQRLLTDLNPRVESRTGRESRAIRVLYVSNASAFSGAEHSLCDLAGHLPKDRFERFALVALRGEFAERLKEAGVAVHVVGREFASPTVENFLEVFLLLRDLAPDLIHINGLAGTALTHAAVILRVPIVQHLRVADLDGYEEPIRVAAAVIAVSDFVKKQALRKSVPFGHIECVWNGVDTGWFKPQVFDKSLMRKEFGIEAEAKVVLLVARFEPRKRHDLLLRAATQIRNSVRGLQLVIVGDPAEARNYTEALHDQIREDGLAETTKILPFQQDIRRIECAADVLVVPSDREPLARCLIEAMAIGLPVVINDSGGDSEVVEDGVTGCIVPHGDPQALADCVSRVLNESDFRDKIAKAARRFAEEHLDIRRHVQEVCRIYERVMSSDMLHSQLPRFRGRAMDETWHDTSSTPPFRER